MRIGEQMGSLLTVVFMSFLRPRAAQSFYMTREECKHAGVPYREPQIIQEFRSSSLLSQSSKDVSRNDMIGHHRLVETFCKMRAKSRPRESRQKRKRRQMKRCSWRDYYHLLDDLRDPFANLYDPGLDPTGEPLEKIQRKGKSGASYQRTCDVIENPTSDVLYEYVANNKPAIIRGLATEWPATQKWKDEYLLKELHGKLISIGVSPEGDIVGPEPAEWWGINDPDESFVITRPAHTTMRFEAYMSLLTNLFIREKMLFKARIENGTISTASVSGEELSRPPPALGGTYYMEYFPVGLLGDKIANDLKPMSFANFLSQRTRLVWMGGGARRVVSKLHFDRHENLMVMIRGSKTFHLFDPGQSGNLYADSPLRSASIKYKLDQNGAMEFDQHGNPIFIRSKAQVDDVRTEYNTYTPVDMAKPNFTTHPRFKNAKGFSCTIHAGDTLFIPSHWWHEVESFDDEYGKNIGVNYFFEPFYHRPGFKSVPPYMQYNRYYNHIRDLKSVSLCDKDEICFTSSDLNDSDSNDNRRDVDADKIDDEEGEGEEVGESSSASIKKQKKETKEKKEKSSQSSKKKKRGRSTKASTVRLSSSKKKTMRLQGRKIQKPIATGSSGSSSGVDEEEEEDGDDENILGLSATSSSSRTPAKRGGGNKKKKRDTNNEKDRNIRSSSEGRKRKGKGKAGSGSSRRRKNKKKAARDRSGGPNSDL